MVTIKELIIPRAEKERDIFSTYKVTKQGAETVVIYNLMGFVINTYRLIDTLYKGKTQEFLYVVQLRYKTADSNVYIFPRLGNHNNITAIMAVQLKPFYQLLIHRLIFTRVILNTSLVYNDK